MACVSVQCARSRFEQEVAVNYEPNGDAESVLVLFYLSVSCSRPTSEMLASFHGPEGKGEGETCQDTNGSGVKLLSEYPAPELLSIFSYPLVVFLICCPATRVLLFSSEQT